MSNSKLTIDQVPVGPGQSSYKVSVPVTWNPIFRRIFRRSESARVFSIDISKVSTVRMISGLSKNLPDSLTGETTTALALSDSYLNQEVLLAIIGASIQNNGKYPDRSLIKFLDRNLTPEMVTELVQVVIAQLKLEAFLNSLILIKGTASILHTPEEAEEARQIFPSENQDHAEG